MMHLRNAGLAALAGLALTLFGAPAQAEDGGSRDRAEFEAAAGRALLFEAISIADNDPLKPRASDRRETGARAAQTERRAVRVILPSPYAR
jgi:hypothetical protein